MHEVNSLQEKKKEKRRKNGEKKEFTFLSSCEEVPVEM